MDFDEIENNFFIGSRHGLSSFVDHHRNSAVSVLTVESEDLKHVPDNVHQRMFIQVDDWEGADLLSHFDAAHDFIQRELERPSAVYVHCWMGISRSATLCAAFMMRRSRLLADESADEEHVVGVEQALHRLRLSRRFVQPNPGFMVQLRLYERMRMHTRPECPLFRKHQLRVTARSALSDVSVLAGLQPPLLAPVSIEGADVVYKCRKCRAALFTQLDLEPDRPVQVDELGDVYRILPLSWMRCVTGRIQGGIACHKCAAKLGNFLWASGSRWDFADDLPRFTITKSRVDRCPRPTAE